MEDSFIKPNVLLELVPGESLLQSKFSLAFAVGLGTKVFLRDSAQVRIVLSEFLLETGFGPEKFVVFSDWMKVFEDVKAANLLAVSCGDGLTGMADRMGIVFLPIPAVPIQWCLSASHPKKIAILGPESSGKTTLMHCLADELGGLGVQEYVRFLWDFRGQTVGSAADVEWIVRAQAALEDAISAGARDLAFCDTEPRQTLVWADVLYGGLKEDLKEFVLSRSYDGYLLCAGDLPWVADGQRCLPGGSQDFFERLKVLVEKTGRPFDVVLGQNEERFECAKKAVEGFITTQYTKKH